MSNSAIVGILRALLTLETAQFETAAKRSAETARVWSRDLRQIGTQATQLGTALTKTLTLPLLALGGASAKAAIDFEQSFANVRKTVEGTAPELDKLAMAIRKMAKEIPATTEELNAIAALGGQMGVPIDQLAHFTKNIAALGVAVDGLSTEEAAAGLAQIGNATGTGTTKIAEMASALVHLGNKSNATEADILEFTKRLVGAGHTAGMTVPEIMAIGTAMANVGINAEAGGTAMSTVISKISNAVSSGGSALTEFARVANMSADQFAETWKRKPVEALDAFIKGLATMRARGVDLNLTMGELGTEGIRVQDTLKRLSGSTDGLSKSIQIANEGFSDGRKHLDEAGKKYETVANQLKILWNQITDVGITIGTAMLPAIKSAISLGKLLIPVVETMAKGFAALPGPIQLGIIGVGGMVAAIGPLLFVAGQLITSLGQVVGAFTKQGIAARGLAAAHDTLAASNVALGGSFRMLLPMLGAVTAALAGLAVASLIQSKAAKQYTDQFKDLSEIEAEIARREAEIARLRQDPDARREVSVIKEHLDALKTKRDVLKQIADEQAKVNAVTAAGFESQGQLPSGKSFAASIAQANKQIQDEIKNTGLTVSQLTKLLSENEAAFKAGAKEMGLSTQTVQFLEQQLQKSKKATADQKKATEELTKATEAQWKQLEKWGIVTKDSVNKQLGELTDGFMSALAQGVPLDKAIALMEPHFQKLAAAAKESGVEVKGLTDQMAEFRRVLPTPKLDSLTLIGGGTESLLKIGVVLKNITAESLSAHAQQVRTNKAFEDFGLKTPQELQRVAQAARDNYRALTESGLASAAQLKEARQKVLEAERAAAGESVSLWRTQIAPAITDTINHLATAVNGLFAQMLLGAKGFKAGFVDILKSLAAAAVNSLNAVLGTFTNALFKGLTSALSGKGFGNAFTGLISGAFGVGGGTAAAVPGLATSTINAGGGFAGAFGTGGAAGLSGAALATLTAGIGAAVIAGFALYSRQNNVTAKSREEFAKQQGFPNLGALYSQLQSMGPRGQDLANQGLNVIGRKDQQANEAWMKQVTAFMETVKNFSSTVTAATGNIAAGFTGKLSNVFDKQTKDQLKAYDDQVAAAQDQTAKLLENEDLTADERKAINDKLSEQLKYIEAQRAQFVKDTNANIVANTQLEFDRISRITLGAFVAARGQGQSEVQAIQTVGGAIDSLAASADRFGFAGNAAFEKLLEWRQLTTVAAPILDQLAGAKDLLTVLGDIGELDQQMFSDLQAQGLETYQALIDSGFSEKQAREAVKPLIEEEIRLAKEKKLKIDEGTQAIIDQMRANGELKSDEQSLIEVFKEGIAAIVKALKGDLPEGWRAAGKAAAEAAEETKRQWSGLRIRIPIDYEAGEFPAPPNGGGWPGRVVGGAQHGAIFTKPTVIGIAEHAPEAAIPLHRLSEMVGGMDGGGQLIGKAELHLHQYMDSRKFAEAVVPNLKWASKRVGVRPI